MIEALSMLNRADIAWLLATQTGYPSWSDMVEKYTTMCEFWTLKQSHNHVMTGSIDAFFYKTLAGIQVDESYPAFKKFIIKPYIPDSLSHVTASIETVRGTIKSGWKQTDNELRLNLTIPVNVSADVYIPASDPSRIHESDILASESDGISYIKSVKGRLLYSVASGTFEFVVTR
jgi:alpha-L-rhamnosidase